MGKTVHVMAEGRAAEIDTEELAGAFMDLARKYGCPMDEPAVGWMERQLRRLKELDDIIDGE